MRLLWLEPRTGHEAVPPPRLRDYSAPPHPLRRPPSDMDLNPFNQYKAPEPLIKGSMCYSVELRPAFTGGVAVLVDRFGVEKTCQEHYKYEPKLREHLSNGNGYIDVKPHYIVARLFAVAVHNKEEFQKATLLVRDMEAVVREWADDEMLRIEFCGTPVKDFEGGRNVWKVWAAQGTLRIKDIRFRLRDAARLRGFREAGPYDPDDEIHIVLRNLKRNSEVFLPAPEDTSNFTLFWPPGTASTMVFAPQSRPGVSSL